MLSIKHHELKIAYLKHRIANMPHGKFGTKGGRKVIYITFDPNDKSIDIYHKRVVRIDSDEGRLYMPVISEYLRLQRQLDNLTDLWDSIYWKEPRQIEYPLKKVRKTGLNVDYFNRAAPNQNPYKPEELRIEYKGQWFRSKNELSAAQAAESLGYRFKSEILVIGPKKNYEHFPDVSVEVPELDLMIMSEIDGAMDKESYRIKSVNRQNDYFEDGFREFKDVVFIRMLDSGTFDASEYRTALRMAIETNIDDLLLDR